MVITVVVTMVVVTMAVVITVVVITVVVITVVVIMEVVITATADIQATDMDTLRTDIRTTVTGMGTMAVGTTVIGTPETAAIGGATGTLMELERAGVSGQEPVGFGSATDRSCGVQVRLATGRIVSTPGDRSNSPPVRLTSAEGRVSARVADGRKAFRRATAYLLVL